MAAHRYILLLFGLPAFVACSERGDPIRPRQTPITESVYASLTIQPDSLYRAFAVVSGIVERNCVEEGERVEVGDSLVVIKNEDAELNLANARLVYKQAREDLKGDPNALVDLENQIETAELQLRDDSINYFRQKNLWDQEIGTRVEFEKKKLAYELASNRLSKLEAEYRRRKRELEVRYQQAANDYRLARLKRSDFTVRSKIRGRVYALEKEPGENVTIQEPVAVLGSAGHFVIEMRIDERDIARIRTGQPVFLTLEAYGDQVFRAEVTKIRPQKNERNQTFRVEAAFTEPFPGKLYAGLSGEANIRIAQKKSALTIPAAYLTKSSRVRTDAGLVKVKTGLRSLERVEILAGIDSSTTLHLPE